MVRFGGIVLPIWGMPLAKTKADFDAVPKMETVAAGLTEISFRQT